MTEHIVFHSVLFHGNRSLVAKIRVIHSEIKALLLNDIINPPIGGRKVLNRWEYGNRAIGVDAWLGNESQTIPDNIKLLCWVLQFYLPLHDIMKKNPSKSNASDARIVSLCPTQRQLVLKPNFRMKLCRCCRNNMTYDIWLGCYCVIQSNASRNSLVCVWIEKWSYTWCACGTNFHELDFNQFSGDCVLDSNAIRNGQNSVVGATVVRGHCLEFGRLQSVWELHYFLTYADFARNLIVEEKKLLFVCLLWTVFSMVTDRRAQFAEQLIFFTIATSSLNRSSSSSATNWLRLCAGSLI